MPGFSTVLRPPDPDRSRFFNPWNHRGWIRYLTGLLQRFQYIQFLGLPVLKDNPDVRVDEFYVPMQFAQHAVPPRDAETVQARPIEPLVAERGRLIVLGDPGSGKSTLVKYLTTMLASRCGERLDPCFEGLIPLPIVLRDFAIGRRTTYGQLWEQFRSQPFWPDELTAEDLDAVLRSGQALVLLDGLDEVGSAERREALRWAVLREGIRHAPDCRWIVTSRIVGYEDVPWAFPAGRGREEMPFEMDRAHAISDVETDWRSLKVFRGHAETIDSTFADPVYVAPFNNAQIARFVETWYALREADPHRRAESAASLERAIHASPVVERLARIPNLLTIMALIHRVRARLPNGRAILFNEIAQAYLESIDEYYGIRELDYPLAHKKRWLAHVGFQMQLRRTARDEKEDPEQPSEILADSEDVLRWVADAMEQSGYPRDEQAARAFVDHITRRSGLLLPRGPGRFAFLHLAFQEYFAACHLDDLLQQHFAARFLGAGGGDSAAAVDRIPGFVGERRWRETLIFLFELVAERPGLAPALAQFLFGPDFRAVEEAPLQDESAAVLLASLVVDPHSGLPGEIRDAARTLCCRRILEHQSEFGEASHGISYRGQVSNVLRSLFAAEGHELALVWREFLSLVRNQGRTRLYLSGAPVSDLNSLAGLAELRYLELSKTSVSDLGPLAGLTELRILLLDGTSVSDLSPLAGLAELRYLELSKTSVSDLSPLARLAELRTLDLSGTSVSDLRPLAELAELQSLNLRGASVSNLSPLAGLAKLRELFLRETSVSRKDVTEWQAARKRSGLREVRLWGI